MVTLAIGYLPTEVGNPRWGAVHNPYPSEKKTIRIHTDGPEPYSRHLGVQLQGNRVRELKCKKTLLRFALSTTHLIVSWGQRRRLYMRVQVSFGVGVLQPDKVPTLDKVNRALRIVHVRSIRVMPFDDENVVRVFGLADVAGHLLLLNGAHALGVQIGVGVQIAPAAPVALESDLRPVGHLAGHGPLG